MSMKLIVISIAIFGYTAYATKLLTKEELERNFENIRTNTSKEIQENAALDLITRLLPNHSHLFQVEIDENETRQSFEIIKEENTTILIRGSDGVAICKGFYYYLKYFLNCSISWSGNQLNNLPDPDNENAFPNVQLKIYNPSKFIYYQNVCTWGYSFPWWTWDDWRKHIDWMAMLGITLTIAPIQEQIWTKIYKDIGLTKYEIDEHLSGQGFLPWQRMGNIRGWGGPLTKDFKQKQFELQKKIIQAQRDLGMLIAIPAFAGHVPIAFKRIYSNTTLTAVDCWNRFSKQYCCPLFIDPNEPLFHDIGTKFLNEVIQAYGTDHLYFSDPFNEIQPRKAESNYLALSSKNIYAAMTTVDPDAIWLLQGWMFVKNPFWSDHLMESFLTAVPQGKLLILDLQSELFPQYERTKSYFGQPFIWCMLHNFGGTLGMHGSVDIVNNRIEEAWDMANSTMVGVGITPEGINQNYVMYEFALEHGWFKETLDVDEWFKKYTHVRYGISDSQVEESWKILRNTVYSYKNLIKLHGKYTVARRPSLNINPWTWYDPIKIKRAWELMLNANESLHESELYQYDLVDLTRQFLQLAGDSIYLEIVKAYQSKNNPLFSILCERMLKVFDDLERILRTNENFLLGTWLKKAKDAAGDAELEKEIFELNARNQITIWGPNGQIVDYATKQWSGVVIDYFTQRWKLFMNELKQCLKHRKHLNETRFKTKIFKDVEHPFTVSQKIYPTYAEGDTVDIALDIHDYWSKQMQCEHLKLNNIPIRIGDGCNFLNVETERPQSSIASSSEES